MVRAVLLALLAIPILVAIHIELVWQHLPRPETMVWAVSPGGNRDVACLQCDWRGDWRAPAVHSYRGTKYAPGEGL